MAEPATSSMASPNASRDYGPPRTLYSRWKRWSRMGVFAKIMTELAAQAHQVAILDNLRGLKVVPPFEAVVADGPASAVLDRYRRLLRVEQSLVSGTGDRYVACLRSFLDRRIATAASGPMVLVWRRLGPRTLKAGPCSCGA